MTEQWTETKDQLPPEGVIVKGMDSGGYVQKFKRRGNLWWFADDSMYVYFTPVRWCHDV